MSELNNQTSDQTGLADDVEAHRIKDGVAIEGDDTEGHRHAMVDGPDEDADVEGHRNRPDRNRPDFLSGAERNRPDLLEDDDVEGHRIIGSNVQPPRDADLGGTEH